VIVSLMQPYLFPYIGYFQLIAASDLFVVYDDVQYMKGGWVNRNRIQVNGAATWLTLPVEKASYRESIAARRYVDDPAVRHRLVKTIELAYGSAPHFAATMPLVREILLARHASVAAFNTESLLRICAHIGISTAFQLSSAMSRKNLLHGEERVIEICRQVEASTYLNLPGGAGLYTEEHFEARGIRLRFLNPRIANRLSIVDVLMREGTASVREMLKQYEVVAPGS
jgi:hypothetical protein